MSVLEIILLIGLSLTCLLMVLLVLMQRPRQEGLGATFGVDVTSQMFGSRATDVLQKGTVIMTVFFFLSCIALSMITAHQSKKSVKMGERLSAIPAAPAPAPTPSPAPAEANSPAIPIPAPFNDNAAPATPPAATPSTPGTPATPATPPADGSPAPAESKPPAATTPPAENAGTSAPSAPSPTPATPAAQPTPQPEPAKPN